MIHVGFDIGGTNIKAGLVDDEGRLSVRRNVPFPREEYHGCVREMQRLIGDMLAEAKLTLADVADIGIAVPGSIDPDGGMVLDAYNLGFHNVPLRAEIEKLYPGIPVALANDANVAALAEMYGGVFTGCKTAVLLTLGTGVGSGLILGGRLFNGGRGHGVEMGHMTLIYDGPECTCGNRGCIEAVCAATWLADQGRKEAGEHPQGAIAVKVGGRLERVNAKTVIDCAKEGDPAAVAIFQQYVDYLSSAIASIASMLDPEVIALGGGVSLAGDFLFAPLRKRVQEKCFFHCQYDILPAAMGNNAGTIGAAMLVSSARENVGD